MALITRDIQFPLGKSQTDTRTLCTPPWAHSVGSFSASCAYLLPPACTTAPGSWEEDRCGWRRQQWEDRQRHSSNGTLSLHRVLLGHATNWHICHPQTPRAGDRFPSWPSGVLQPILVLTPTWTQLSPPVALEPASGKTLISNPCLPAEERRLREVGWWVNQCQLAGREQGPQGLLSQRLCCPLGMGVLLCPGHCLVS